MLLFSTPAERAAAEDAAPPSETRFGWGKKHVAVAAGYGVGFRFGSASDRRKSRELGDVGFVEVIPRFGIGVTEIQDPHAWWRGNFDLLFEGALGFNTNTRFGYFVGGGISLRYNFLARERLVPFLDASFGLVHLNVDLRGQSDGLNFKSGVGGGFHWFLTERLTVTPEVRWQHISNAGLRSPNNGINNVLFLLGTSFFAD